MVTVEHPRCFVGPLARPDIEEAVRTAGGAVASHDKADAIIWTGDEPELLRSLLHPRVRWVHFSAAGVDTWFSAGVMDGDRIWTASKGVAAQPIAEHALCLMLAAARDLPARIAAKSWGAPGGGRKLAGTTVGIVGAGAIGEALIALLQPFGVEILALTRTGRRVPGATLSVGPDDLDDLLVRSDWVVVAAPATARTYRMLDEHALEHMRQSAWIVNVSRGSVIDTDALVSALVAGRIGGAALDVTDPEPLPEWHPLWRLNNVIITPHVATTPEMHAHALCERVRDNVSRFSTGDALLGPVGLDEGY